MGSSPPTTAPPTSSSTTPPSRLTVTAASRTTSGSSTPSPRGPRARRPRRSTRSEIAALHCGIRVIRRYPAPRQSAGPRHGGPPATASELGQLRAGHGDPYQAPGEIDDQGGVVFDTDDPAEPVLIVCYLGLLRAHLGGPHRGRRRQRDSLAGGAGWRRGQVSSLPVCARALVIAAARRRPLGPRIRTRDGGQGERMDTDRPGRVLAGLGSFLA